MTRDEIIALAIEAGDEWASTNPEDQKFLIRFAGLVAAAERAACNGLWEDQRLTDSQISDHIEAAVAAERAACAKVAEEYKEDCYDGDSEWCAANTIFEEIKSRGQE